jgi:hypothetical protein
MKETDQTKSVKRTTTMMRKFALVVGLVEVVVAVVYTL